MKWTYQRDGRSDAMQGKDGWNPDNPDHCGHNVYNETTLVCHLPDPERWRTLEQTIAHGKLIAAAPDLLEALRECITENGAFAFASDDFYKAKQRLLAITNIAREAIAKATA